MCGKISIIQLDTELKKKKKRSVLDRPTECLTKKAAESCYNGVVAALSL